MNNKLLLTGLCLAAFLLPGCTPKHEGKASDELTDEGKVELFITRRSIRLYKDEMPPKEQLALVAKAGSYAPSGMGKQSAKIIVVTNREVRDRLSRLNMNLRGGTHDPYYGAPAVIVVLADKSVPTYLYDGSVVMANMLNAAHALGLATCWVHGADQMFETKEGKELLKEWNIEGDYVGIAQCIIGYNDGDYPQPDPRKPDYITWIE